MSVERLDSRRVLDFRPCCIKTSTRTSITNSVEQSKTLAFGIRDRARSSSSEGAGKSPSRIFDSFRKKKILQDASVGFARARTVRFLFVPVQPNALFVAIVSACFIRLLVCYTATPTSHANKHKSQSPIQNRRRRPAPKPRHPKGLGLGIDPQTALFVRTRRASSHTCENPCSARFLSRRHAAGSPFIRRFFCLEASVSNMLFYQSTAGETREWWVSLGRHECYRENQGG